MTRLEDLQRKLAAREGLSEYRENVKFLKAEIARITGIPILPEKPTDTAIIHGAE